ALAGLAVLELSRLKDLAVLLKRNAIAAFACRNHIKMPRIVHWYFIAVFILQDGALFCKPRAPFFGAFPDFFVLCPVTARHTPGKAPARPRPGCRRTRR